MTIAYNSKGSNTGSTSTSVGSLTVTAGQLITVVAPLVYTSAQTPAAGDLTKDAGSATIGTPTLDKYIVFNSGNAPYYTGIAFYSVLVTGSGSLAVRVTPTGGSVVVAMHVSIWDGTWNSSRVENAPTIASSTTDNQTSFPSASATSAGAALFLSGLSVMQTVNNTITKDAAYTLLTSYQDGTSQAVGGAAYHLVGSGTTEAATWTAAAASNYGWSSGLVVYREAASNINVSIDTAGAITWAGQTVAADVTGGNVNVSIDTAGAITWAGQDVTASTASPVNVSIDTAGAIGWTGQTLDATISIDVTNGAWGWAGQDITTEINSDIEVAIDAAGLWGWSGQDIGTALSGDIAIPIDTAGAIEWAGQTVATQVSGDVDVSIDTAGAITWAGQDIAALLSGDIAVAIDVAGAITWGGQLVASAVTIQVPDVVGDAQATGTATLEGVGFVVSVSMAYSATVPEGDIKSQSPAAGAQAVVGSTVTITVSRGVAPMSSGYSIGGTAFDAEGRMMTQYLAPEEALPAAAKYLCGIAHDDNGVRYVTTWPTNRKFIDGFAMRMDGVQVVATTGKVGAIAGLPVTRRGELVVTESSPSRSVGGFGLASPAAVSVTDAG